MKNITENTIVLSIGITLATAVLYAAGWSYAEHWFAHFNLGLIPLGLPTEYHFLYGFWVVLDHGWWLLAAFALVLFLWHNRPPTPPWARWLILPLVVVGFALVYRLGEVSADRAFGQHRAAGFTEYPLTRVWLSRVPDQVPGDDPDRDSMLAGLAKGLAAGEYRLLVESDTSLFLIKPKPGGEMPTVEIPLRRVVATRRIPVNPGLMETSR